MNNDLRTMMERYEQELLLLRQQAVPTAAVSMPSETFTAPTETFTAPFQVRATAANEALPIANALVVVSRETADGPVVENIQLTGISGLTEPILLPATDPSLTMQPADNIPLVTYEVQVSAPGYFRVQNNGIPLYGGIKTVLPVTMIPLPEFEDQDAVTLEYTVPRNNL